jgi:protocatechuate 3,4-dioxygenase beta subunit
MFPCNGKVDMTRISRRVLIYLCSAVWVTGGEQDPPWRARLADEKETGERLTIRGRVLRTTGGAPAAGSSIMVYQTDAAGIYSSQSGRPIDVARLRGQFRTGPNGEFEIVTIRPGAYPGGGVPAHIHVNLLEPGKPPREVFEFFFSGDPRLRGTEKGYVLQLRKDHHGNWVAVQDVALDR